MTHVCIVARISWFLVVCIQNACFVGQHGEIQEQGLVRLDSQIVSLSSWLSRRRQVGCDFCHWNSYLYLDERTSLSKSGQNPEALAWEWRDQSRRDAIRVEEDIVFFMQLQTDSLGNAVEAFCSNRNVSRSWTRNRGWWLGIECSVSAFGAFRTTSMLHLHHETFWGDSCVALFYWSEGEED